MGAWAAVLNGCSSEANGTCGVADAGSSECAVSACAQDCTDLRDAVKCCTAAGGYGLEDQDILTLRESCSGSSCDSTAHISAETALCVAQVYGLEAGIGYCGVLFVPSETSFTWLVSNTITETQCTQGDQYFYRSGEMVRIESQTAELLDDGIDVSSTLECP